MNDNSYPQPSPQQQPQPQPQQQYTQQYAQQPQYAQQQPQQQYTQQYAQQQPRQQYAQPQQQTRYAQQVQYSQPATTTPEPTKQRSGHPFLAALFGGLIGAAAMFGGLTFTGHLGVVTPLVQGQATTAATTQDQSSESDMSSAGPTISIDATNATADIAQVVAKKALPSVVSIYVTTSQGSGVGSGVIIDANGNVLTNYHVVEGAQDITVTIGDNNYVGKVVGSDESSDLAVVHVDTEGVEVTPIEAGDSDALVVGDWVMAIGSPYGLDQSVSTGIVSSLYRSTMLPSTSGRTIYTNLIQTDATINPGNSGGALVNSKGQLVGINSIIQSTTGSSIGLGFAIPSNYAVEVAREIIAGEMVLHPYIGLSLQTVTAQNAHLHNLPVNQGAFVAAVIEGGPAEAAGIQQGDIIIKVGRDNITSADALILAVRSHKIGETVSVTLMRGTEQVTLDVTLASDEPLQQASGDYGLSGQDNGGGEGYGNNSNGG